MLALLASLTISGCPRPLDRLAAERESRPGRPSLDDSAAQMPQESRATTGPNADQPLADDMTAAERLLGEGGPANEQTDTVDGWQPAPGDALPGTGPPPTAEEFLKQRGPAEPDPAAPESNPVPLSIESLSGRWVVLAIASLQDVRVLDDKDAWKFDLGGGGQAAIVKVMDNKYWSNVGGWDLAEDTLRIDLGPGGLQEYRVRLVTSDICLMMPEAEGVALFAARIPDNEPAFEPRGEYDSDFGKMTFSSSGPGHVKAVFGDPAGNLALRMEGRFGAGSWDQDNSGGFALLEFSADGFEGIWWRSGSLGEDGFWRGRRSGGSA